MISYVAKAINLITQTVQNVILIASLTGELIISAGLWTYNIVSYMINNVVHFLQIVYEDNICIFTEIPNSAKDAVDSTLKQVLYIQHVIEKVYHLIYSETYSIFTSFVWFTNAIYVIVSEVFKLFTNTMIFMGDTTWLLVTFIPIHLPRLVKLGAVYIANITVNATVDAYMRLLKFTNYLTEVPLESFLGITSAIIIVRLCVHFRETIIININLFYLLLVRNMLYLYHLCHNYFTNPEVQMITQMASGDIMTVREMPFEDVPDDINSAVDSLCVICQERQKCVLTLPCRHICLCTECCRRLYGYQRTCPICRTFIYHSVTVYL